MSITDLDNYEHAIEMYILGKPVMTDEEFDVLEEKLSFAGIDTVVVREDIVNKHSLSKFPMTTLVKRSFEETMAFIEKYECRIEPKYDGVAIEVFINPDNTVFASGRSGTDFTHVVKQVVDPQYIVSEYGNVVYGEMVIAKSTPLPEKYKNRRNAVAGILNSNTPSSEDISLLQFVPYATGKAGELVPVGAHLLANKDSSIDILQVAAKAFDANIDTETDGVVIKANWPSVREELGFNGLYNWQFCYKFQDELHETTVTSIDWQVSANGKVTPVANFTPVNDSLGTISRASIASAQKLEDLGISAGARVFVKRANKVIPYISDVIEPGAPVEIPEEVDNKKTYRKGAHLFVDTKMYDNPLATIRHQVALLGAKNVTSSKINKAIEQGATDIFSFYRYLANINDHFTMEKLQDLFEKRTPGQWLLFLNIPGIGAGKIKLIDEEYSSLRNLGSVYFEKMHGGNLDIQGFSPSIEDALVNNSELILQFADTSDEFFEEFPPNLYED